MIKVALTGNIGSGKSTVAKIFSVFGVPVFNSDIEARIMYYNADVKAELMRLFSNSIFTPNNEVDTKKLAAIIFSNKQALQSVNNIIHPLVIKKYDEWCQKHKNQMYTIHESAILFENNLQDNFDFIINVSAPKNIRIERVMQRDSVTKSTVEARMANQLSDKIKCNKSHFVINNDGSTFVIPQVQLIHNKLINM